MSENTYNPSLPPVLTPNFIRYGSYLNLFPFISLLPQARVPWAYIKTLNAGEQLLSFRFILLLWVAGGYTVTRHQEPFGTSG